MDIVDNVLGGIDHAALFGVNAAPTRQEIEAAQRDTKLYGEAAERLVDRVGLRKGLYVVEQPIYGPLVRLLALAGWTVGGSGFFSVAFYKGGLAMKISLRGSGDAGLDYTKWALQHEEMPGVPTFYAVGEYEFTYSVLMERYESARHLLRENGDEFNEYLSAEFNEIADALENGSAPLYFATGATALAIGEEFAGVADFDMHPGNVMVDRDGKLIITDPLGRSSSNDTRYGGWTYSNSSNDNYRQAA